MVWVVDVPLNHLPSYWSLPDGLVSCRNVCTGNALEDVHRLRREVIFEPANFFVGDGVAAFTPDVVVAWDVDERFDWPVKAAVDGVEAFGVRTKKAFVDFAAC